MKNAKCSRFFFLFFCLVWLVGRCCDYNYLVVHTFVHTMTRAFNIRTWHNHHLYSMHTHRINLNWTNIRTHQKRRKNSQCGSHSQESEARIASDREREYREEKKIIKKKKRTEFTFFVVAFFFPAFQINFGWFCCFIGAVAYPSLFLVQLNSLLISPLRLHTLFFIYFVCLVGWFVGWEALSSINYLDC